MAAFSPPEQGAGIIYVFSYKIYFPLYLEIQKQVAEMGKQLNMLNIKIEVEVSNF